MEPRVFEKGTEICVVVEVEEPTISVLGEINPRYLLNSDRILLVGKDKLVEVSRDLIQQGLVEKEKTAVERARERIDRNYGTQFYQLASGDMLFIRIPRKSVREISEDDTKIVEEKLREIGEEELEKIVGLILVADEDHVRPNLYKVLREVFGRSIPPLPYAHRKALAISHLTSTHRIVRNLRVIDASCIPYTVEVLAIRGNEKVALSDDPSRIPKSLIDAELRSIDEG